MKLILTALCASFMVAPVFAGSECEKGKCDKEKEKGTIAACKDGDCSKEKKEDGALAGCKDGDCGKDKKKEEGTLAGGCKDGDCGKDKKKQEGTLA